jgi:hypothetical protein
MAWMRFFARAPSGCWSSSPRCTSATGASGASASRPAEESDHVTVGLLQVATLKGNKEEYYPDGTEVVDCSKSIFPQTGAGACWWVESHRTVFER